MCAFCQYIFIGAKRLFWILSTFFGAFWLIEKRARAILFRNVPELLINVFKYAQLNKVAVNLKNSNVTSKPRTFNTKIKFLMHRGGPKGHVRLISKSKAW